MQTDNARDHDLIQSLSSTIAELPDATVNDFAIEPVMTLQARPDASLEVSIAGQELLLIIETLETAYPRDVREKIWQITQYQDDVVRTGHEVVPMLVANTISVGARKTLKDAKIGYYDASGALFLPAKHTYVLLDKPPRPKKRKIEDAIFRGQRAQVLQCLFASPEEWFSVKEIAQRTDISTATTSETLSVLERREWVETEGSGPTKVRRLSSTVETLDAWTQYVISQKKPDMDRFFVPVSNIDKLMEQLDKACRDRGLTYAITGEAAAQIYSPYLSSITRILCRMGLGQSRYSVLEDINARPVADGWNFAIISGTRKNEAILHNNHKGLSLAPPLQVYLDLLNRSGQSKEMAKHLRETRLVHKW